MDHFYYIKIEEPLFKRKANQFNFHSKEFLYTDIAIIEFFDNLRLQ